MFGDVPERLDRYRRFYAVEEPALLVHIRCASRADSSRPRRPHYLKRLREFDFRREADRLRWFSEIHGEVLDENRLHAVPDDYLPSVKVLLPFSLILRDRPLHHTEHSSWVEPCLGSLEEAYSLRFSLDESNFWWGLLAGAKAYAAERVGSEGFAATAHLAGPMDLAYDLRGDALYTDLYDDPEGVRGLLETCTDAVIRIADALRAVRPAAPGTPPQTDGSYWVPGWGFNVMVPGQGCHFTMDTSCQLSPAALEAFEAPCVRRLIAHAPGCLLHSHSVAAHQQAAYAAMEGLEIIQVVADPNVPDPVEDIDALLGRVGTKPLILTSPPGRIARNIDRLARGRIVLRTDVSTEADARELLALVRRHSRVR